jgi:hypothetical protein
VQSILAGLAALEVPPEIANRGIEELANHIKKPVKDVFLALDDLAMKIQILGSLLGGVLGYLYALDCQKSMPR